LLGPAIIDAIRIRRTVKSLTSALVLELNDLRDRLVEAAFTLGEIGGALDKDALEWFRSTLKKMPEPNKLTVDLVDDLLGRRAAEINQIIAARVAQLSGETLLLPEYGVPVLDMALQYLPRFSAAVQRNMLAIKTELSFLNQDAADIRQQYLLAFQKHVAENLSAVVQANAARTYRLAFTTARNIINSATAAVRALGGT